MRALIGQRVWMNCLLLLAHRPGGDGYEAEVGVISHHSLRLAALSRNHIRPIHGHRVIVIVVVERS